MESYKNTQDYEKYYNEGAFWSKMKNITKKAGLKLIYLAFLLYYTLSSYTISTMDRTIIIGALGYFIFPLDIIPDYIPFFGYTDDLTILLYAYRRVKVNITDDIRNNAKNKLSSFFGNYNIRDIEEY